MSDDATLNVYSVDRLDTLPAAAWNALVEDDNPFLRHEFLAALERHGCVGDAAGWVPHHLVCSAADAPEQLLGAVPLYIKDNSFGEFVFDWGWADAYRRNGLDYYPKLVCAVPFTPAGGQRLLLGPGSSARREAVAGKLIDAALIQTRAYGGSSLHWLFVSEADGARLRERGFMERIGCHFHWHNDGYRAFGDFTAALVAKKRKNINRERRLVSDAGVRLRTLSGNDVSDDEWRTFHRFYSNTFFERGRHPPLSLEFFLDVGASLGEQVVLVLATHDGRDVAGAISFRSATSLFGRHWGCAAEFDSLHFECCYYQNIDFCIRHGLRRFEPGVQGEHKIWRGFMPTITRSAHWLEHPAFSAAVGDFLRRETDAVRAYARELSAHSPYRQCERGNAQRDG